MARPNQAPHRGHPDAPAHWTRADPWRARHELGQRKRVAHIPTAETEAARSGLILEGHGQASLHFKFNPSWSYEWGPVQFVHNGIEIDLLPLLELHQPGASDRVDVNIDVKSPVNWLDKTVALPGVEPFHGSGFHGSPEIMHEPHVRGVSHRPFRHRRGGRFH